uniref:Uncharacterized protein n=1 Tax=Trypanosoma congolense (strain IL3000) TaxID=1068625 RepID=G0UPN2_TRYCI|nr:hypothetical protein TCIL3000_7_1500 [Trypanosoma congolense IL3000]
MQFVHQEPDGCPGGAEAVRGGRHRHVAQTPRTKAGSHVARAQNPIARTCTCRFPQLLFLPRFQYHIESHFFSLAPYFSQHVPPCVYFIVFSSYHSCHCFQFLLMVHFHFFLMHTRYVLIFCLPRNTDTPKRKARKYMRHHFYSLHSLPFWSSSEIKVLCIGDLHLRFPIELQRHTTPRGKSPTATHTQT